MGMRYRFQCNKCDYNVESAGDESMGMQAVVSPYICNDCNIVTDAMVGMYGDTYLKDWFENPKGSPLSDIALSRKDEFFTCEECEGDNLTDWNPKWRKCPKCSGRMLIDKDKPAMLWD
tara:strand:- start:713 stop:1066 length:354 start_codon:yes stop_codon:yes gene_type:complete